jgi:predicted NBD/HSP70 family sugar kinase
MQTMYYIGLDVHKRTISYCVKDGSGTIHAVHSRPSALASNSQFFMLQS